MVYRNFVLWTFSVRLCIIPLYIYVPLLLYKILNLSENRFPKYYTTTLFFKGKIQKRCPLFRILSWIIYFILFLFYFNFNFFSSLQTRSSEIQQQNSKNTVQILTQYVYIPRVFGMYTLGLRVVCIIIRNTQNNVTIYLTTPSSSKKNSKHSIRHSKLTE